MSLRVAAAAGVLLVLLLSGQAIGQSTTSSLPKTVQVSEGLPWFDQKGVGFGYNLAGSFPGLGGKQTYQGSASVQVLGLSSNQSLEVRASSTTANAIFPNGTLYDDPFFPSYVQVFPVSLVIPKSFTVLAPTYGLAFKFLGNITTDFLGAKTLTYAYSVSASSSGQGQSQVAKYYRVLPSDGLVVQEGLANTATGSTFNLTLTSLSRPAANSSSPFEFASPDYAAPGAYIEFKNPGVGNQLIRYTTIFSEPSGVFAYERTVEGNGSSLGSQFFIDEFPNPLFYPATSSFLNTIDFPVAVGSLETGVLALKGETEVDTPFGYFNTHSYANQTIGFEAYLDDATGVAVYLELPGGFLELSGSNFLMPASPPAQNQLVSDVLLVAIAAVVVALVFFHFRKSPRKPGRR